jgi:hypothetical protein
MKYLMAPMCCARFVENESVSRTRRDTRCRNVVWKRSMCSPLARCRIDPEAMWPAHGRAKGAWPTALGHGHDCPPPPRHAMLWCVLASRAMQSHDCLAFFFTTRPMASASASSRRRPTSVGRGEIWPCQAAGQAAKPATIKCDSHGRLTPTARQRPRSERRSRPRCSIRVRCASALRWSSVGAPHGRTRIFHG